MFSTLMRNRINSCKTLYISDMWIIYGGVICWVIIWKNDKNIVTLRYNELVQP